MVTSAIHDVPDLWSIMFLDMFDLLTCDPMGVSYPIINLHIWKQTGCSYTMDYGSLFRDYVSIIMPAYIEYCTIQFYSWIEKKTLRIFGFWGEVFFVWKLRSVRIFFQLLAINRLFFHLSQGRVWQQLARGNKRQNKEKLFQLLFIMQNLSKNQFLGVRKGPPPPRHCQATVLNVCSLHMLLRPLHVAIPLGD